MRACKLDFARNRYDCAAGVVGEHNATQLIVIPPYCMPETAVYRLCFEPGGVSELLHRDDNGEILYPLPGTVTVNGNCTVTLIGYVGDAQVYKSRMACLHFSPSANDGEMSIDPQESGLAAEVTANTLARHTHVNKTVLDKLGEGDGNLTYDGKPISAVSTAELTINVKLTDTDSIHPTATADKTYDELSAAYAVGTKLAVEATVDEDEITAMLPLVYVSDGFCFAASLTPGTMTLVACGSDGWIVESLEVDANNIVYDDMPLSFVLTNLGNKVDANTKDRHAHSNKTILDSLSETDGKLKYNGSDAGLKGADGITYTPSVSSDGTLSWTNNGDKDNPPSVNIKGTKGDKGDPGKDGTNGTDGKTPVKGTDYWTADDKAEIVADVLAALPDGDEVSY